MIRDYLRLLRISHWVKNSFVFVPLIFSKHLFEWGYLSLAINAFFAFSLTASVVYIINDILDISYDKNHPVKRSRPIASGIISIKQSIFIIAVLVVLLFPLILRLNLQFNLILLSYAILNIFYSIKLKEIVIVDILTIAAGFMLRIISGAIVIDVNISSWLILTTLFLSIFLGVMKRKSELNLYYDLNTRSVLKEYTDEFINQIAGISAGGVVICYALYSVAERTIKYFNTENLVFTIIFVIFGVFRYMYVVYNRKKGENIFEIILKDLPMIINIILYVICIVIVIY